MTGVEAAERHLRAHLSRFVAELAEFVSIPSVSSLPEHRRDVRACAGWLARRLRAAGAGRVEVLETRCHPVVWAEAAGPRGSPTVLVYGHYDVQPPGPPGAWRTPPFQPRVREGALHGRGASDDKGPLFAHVMALEAWSAGRSGPPVTVRCLFEGAEEVGSPGLRELLAARRDQVAADVAVVSDTRMLGPDRPALTYALRGSLPFEVTVDALAGDAHSGTFGGAVPDAVAVMCGIVAALHDRRGRIAIPGFYDRVRMPSPSERRLDAAVAPSDAELLGAAGATGTAGEPGYTAYERTTMRPALTVNGIEGGHPGPGRRAVLAARARAQLSFRLVPDQEPQEVLRLLRDHLARIAPAAVRVGLRAGRAARPVVLHRREPALRCAARAYERGFGARPVLLRSGGTIPVVDSLRQVLGVPAVLMGFALPDDRMHAPDERFRLSNLARGALTAACFLDEVRHLSRGG
jgi:acetylornithine deacetylase/succinyl-diaminopimelate desuccinylase-like protein